MSIQLIQQAICYMEEHICENINYAKVAKNIHMSSYNFHRTFSFIVGMTANEYIRNRRLTLAAQELQTTDISVIDAAYKYGYESPESFSKAFSRFHGSTPKQAKQKGAKLHLFNPLVIKIMVVLWLTELSTEDIRGLSHWSGRFRTKLPTMITITAFRIFGQNAMKKILLNR